jgi:LPS export ABC transporter protein LptC/lipopolysaccharide transport protein LptA
MQEIGRKKTLAFGLRAALPYLLRVVAAVLFFGGVGFFIYTYINRKPTKPFVITPGKPQLSEQVVSRVEGFEQRISDGQRLTLLIRAAVDVTYSDGHHELEFVEIEKYNEEGQKLDKIKANRAIYLPGQQKLDEGEVFFEGNVYVETKDNLIVKTESLSFDQKDQIIKSDVALNFQRENISGQTTGAVIQVKQKHLEMKKDVFIQVISEKPSEPPFIIRAGHGAFSERERTLNFTNGATAEQGQNYMSGDRLFAVLTEKKKVQRVESNGNAYLRSVKDNGTAELRSVDMVFNFDANQQLEHATATQNVSIRSMNAQSEMQLTGADKLDASFQIQNGRSMIKEVTTQGRATVTMSAPQNRSNDSRAANKKLIADTVKLNWRAKGKDLERAEAVGNAELYVEPVQASQKNDRKILKASRFDCEFYETDNLAKTFVASGGSTAILEPMQNTQERQTRTLTSDKITAIFTRETQDAEKLEAQGNVKFKESDREGKADSATYTAWDETIRLRGGEPTVWDSRARVKANEIDWDTKAEVANARGKVATTYYSQEKTNGATPFEKTNSPVYVTADRAEYNQITNVGVYYGNARAWQDDNFVRADRLTLRGDNKVMVADGKVQSAIYNAKRKDKSGAASIVPVFALSERMTYSDGERLVRYETNVDIRQGTDRITCAVADIYLQKGMNEVEKTIAQQNVVMTQPGRRGTGDWAQYTLADETFVLKGNPAKVEDHEQGTNEGGVITVYVRENKVITQGSNGQQSGGRVRTTHPIKKP